MTDVFFAAIPLSATVPIFLAVMLGSALAHRQVVAPDSWQALQRLNYFLFIPAMFLSGIATAGYDVSLVVRLVIATALVLAVGTVAVWWWRSRTSTGFDLGPQLLEGSIRANVPYGMGVSLAIGGTEGLQLFLVAAATYLPSVIIAGGLFAQLAGRRRGNPEAEQQYAFVSALRLLAQNPIVIAVAIGAVLNATGLPLASGLAAVAQTAGYAAVPIGLLGAGAALSLAAAQNALDAARADVVITLAIKLVALPLLGGLACLALGLSGAPAVALVLIAASPCVVPRFSVATGAPPVLTGIVTIATVLSVATLPVALWLLT